MAGVVLLSHRGPVSFGRDEAGRRTASRGAGGLVTALTGLVSDLPDAVWVCAAGSEEDAAVAAEHGGQAVPVTLDGEPGRSTTTKPGRGRRPSACAWSRSTRRPTTTSTR